MERFVYFAGRGRVSHLARALVVVVYNRLLGHTDRTSVLDEDVVTLLLPPLASTSKIRRRVGRETAREALRTFKQQKCNQQNDNVMTTFSCF